MQSKASTVHLWRRLFLGSLLLALVFVGTEAVGRRCIVTSTSIRPTSWTVSQKHDNILFSLSVPDEYRYEDDSFNFFQSVSLTFDNDCDALLSFNALAEKTLDFVSNNNWTVRYYSPLDATDCGTFLFERLLPIADAVKNNACFQKIWTPDASSLRLESVTGRIKRTYGVTTRTFATTRFLEDNVQIILNVTHVNQTFFGAADSSSGISIYSSKMVQNTLESYSIEVVAHTIFPQMLETIPTAQNGLVVTSNCSNSTISVDGEVTTCEHKISGGSFRASMCLTTSDTFSAVVRATCASATSCSFEGPVSIELTPESSGCTLSRIAVSKMSSQLLSVRGPVADPSGALEWSTQHKPLIPAGMSAYFMVDIMASSGKSGVGRLLTLQAHTGDKTVPLAAEQDLNDPLCRRDRVCIQVPKAEIQQLVTQNAYTTLSFSASIDVADADTETHLIASSSTIADILAPNFSDMQTYAQPPYDRFNNDTVGFSIAIAAGLVVLLAALVGFAVSFKSQPVLNPPPTGPTAAGGAV
eukprot:TRINITY_DN14261_c0_g1_i1.p1 TRINITY_DN14261_c0_g1~~TRINITY_DN14261_c0_g1_i1.p1  ORF type:complete len:527 (+),score=79.18 TRINITY_DN14261_c0_g1_i1:243-1823(+)